MPEGALHFRNDNTEIHGFAWQPNSCNLYSLAYSAPRDETFFTQTHIGLMERRFTTCAEKDDPKAKAPPAEKFSVQINFNKPDKSFTFERLPISIQSFLVDERQRNSLFGMNQHLQVLIDLRDKTNVKRFGKPTEGTLGSLKDNGPFHIAHNGSNDVIFAKTDGALLFDVRKAR